ncbi:LysM peptidoglycan-binding domain-containing protein [Aquirufa sp. HETE-83D]|uniref:LysM peptidoglycan-binding domain-containing protein n=1 Tax=Aquirufa esocilacus TaxID=3096513 RepID=A0ABW6DI20_9BACT
MRITLVFGLIFWASLVLKAQEVVPFTQVENTYNFLLHKPENKENQIKPVILFLHGRSLSGNNLNKVKQYGIIDDIIHRGRTVDAYVIAPQVPSGQSWSPDKLKVLLDYVHSNYPTDKCRVYVVGMSLGGYGTMDFVGTYPEEVTAAMALCGGGNVKMAESLAKVPLWIMHGKNDAAVPHSESEKVYNAIQNCCETNLTRFSSFPNYGHGEFARVFYAKQMYDWLYQFEKDQISTDKLMDIEIFDNHLKRVYTDNKPKKVLKVSQPADSVIIKKELVKEVIKSDSLEIVALLPKKQKRDNKSESHPTEIKVAKGDTYYSLSKKYKVAIKDLLKYNKLTEKDLLKEGEKIKIPKR